MILYFVKNSLYLQCWRKKMDVNLLISISTMNLHEQFKDPHSRQVLDALNASIESFSENPLLGNIRGRSLSLDEFTFLSKARLNAATNFVPFLSTIQEKTEEARGWEDISEALRHNLDEELGLTKQGYDRTKDHNTWREKYAYGLSRIWTEGKGDDSTRAYGNIDVSDATEKIRAQYGKKVMTLTETESIPFLAGAFATLEGLLGQEFSAIHEYIRENMSWLTTDESLYIAHHAGHEHRHLEEIAVPLLKKCQKNPHIVPAVIRGIQTMYALRHDHVLAVIEKEMKLFTARCTDTSK